MSLAELARSGSLDAPAPVSEFTMHGCDGHFEENMVVCLECYIGAEDGMEGVKLEGMVLINQHGSEMLPTCPFDDALLA